MKKGQFLEAILRSPKTVFTLEDIALLWGEAGTEAVRVRLSYYVSRGKLHRIRRGLYAKDRNYDRLELATRIYPPSYVSFETILAREGLVFQFHAPVGVASHLTCEIEVDGQVYSFKKIKTPILLNPLGIENRGESSFATRERAFLDTLYIHGDYYFDNLSGLNWDKVSEILPAYQNRRMARQVERLRQQSVLANGKQP